MFIMIFIFFCMKIYAVVYSRVFRTYDIVNLPLYQMVIIQAYFYIIDIRFSLEYFVFSWIYYTMAEQLQCIVNWFGQGNIFERRSENLDCTDIKKWANIYKNVADTSKLLNSMIGIQVCYKYTIM